MLSADMGRMVSDGRSVVRGSWNASDRRGRARAVSSIVKMVNRLLGFRLFMMKRR